MKPDALRSRLIAKQTTAELKRKADKACRAKQKMWTLEEIDAASRRGAELHKMLVWETT